MGSHSSPAQVLRCHTNMIRQMAIMYFLAYVTTAISVDANYTILSKVSFFSFFLFFFFFGGGGVAFYFAHLGVISGQFLRYM